MRPGDSMMQGTRRRGISRESDAHIPGLVPDEPYFTLTRRRKKTLSQAHPSGIQRGEHAWEHNVCGGRADESSPHTTISMSTDRHRNEGGLKFVLVIKAVLVFFGPALSSTTHVQL